MSGICTRSRLEELEALLAKTRHEISYASRRGDPATDLCELETRVMDAIAAEQTPPQFEVFAKPTVDRVGLRLTQLGVTSHDVKVWAHEQGLVDAVKRGRIGADLVEAYADHFAARGRFIAQHDGGTCAECSARLVSASTWRDGNDDQRRLWKSWGIARKGGRGLCTRCWVRLDNHGELERHTTSHTPSGDSTCSRCGLSGIAVDLCRDCEDVTADDTTQEAS